MRQLGYQDTLAKVFILLVIVFVFANGIYNSIKYTEKLWPIDEGHEILTISAARCFAEKGFSSNFGLPNFNCYNPPQTQRTETVHDPTRDKSPRIYTHEPAGPYWLAGLFFKICGGDKYGCPRILSTITGTLALSFFAIILFYALGALKSAVAMLFVAIIPMTRNMIYTLHYHNYAFSLFIIHLGFLIYFSRKKLKLTTYNMTILLVLGFVQGWFTFEYFFLIVLSPLTLALLYSQLDQIEDRKRLIFTMLSLLAGYCLAFLLHYIQNSLYFGSFVKAFNDLVGIGQARLLSNPEKAGSDDRISVLWSYFFVYPGNWFFSLISLPIFSSVIIVLLWFKEVRLKIQTPLKLNLKWASPRRNYLVILTAAIASLLWIFVMYNHAIAEIPHLPRILFFFYFVCILTVLECISLEGS